MAIKGNMTNNKAYMDNLLIIAFSLILNPFSSGTHVGENSISIEYDENARKAKKKHRVPSLSPYLSNVKGTRVERSLSSTNKSSKSNHHNSSNQNYQNKTNSFFTDEELLELDKFGLPEPVTPEYIRIITNRLHEAYHEEKIVCVVCDHAESQNQEH